MKINVVRKDLLTGLMYVGIIEDRHSSDSSILMGPLNEFDLEQLESDLLNIQIQIRDFRMKNFLESESTDE
jgi:hypothetical protein